MENAIDNRAFMSKHTNVQLIENLVNKVRNLDKLELRQQLVSNSQPMWKLFLPVMN